MRAVTGALLLAQLGAVGCAQLLGIEETTLEVGMKADGDDEKPEDAGNGDDTKPVDADNGDDETKDSGGPTLPTSMPEDSGMTPPPPGEDFSCVGMGPPKGDDRETVELVARIVDIATQDPVMGMKVSECKTRLELECSGQVVESDESGIARLTLPNGFNGYLKIEGPDSEGIERVGYLWYFTQPLVESYLFPIQAMSREFRDLAFYNGGGAEPITRSEDRGELAINVVDCSDPDPPTTTIGEGDAGEELLLAPGVNAPNVHLEITSDKFVDEQTRDFYLVAGLFIYPTEREEQLTDGAGLGGFLNVKPGPVPIQGIPDSLGKKFADDVLLVRADFLTTVRLLPE